MGKQTFEEQSRKNWVPSGIGDDTKCTTNQLQVGCLQRIANATETMAMSNEKLKADYEYMRGSRDNYKSRYEALQRKYSAQKGVITKLKKKLLQ